VVALPVSDTGCCIDAATLERVFDRFWSTREGTVGGAGLGLAIAQGIVEANGGAIGVESEPGAGTTFRFTLPVT
jgi:signal transduction histidine kinase